jgi:hypothetical protein
MMAKAKKASGFSYLLSHKAVSKGSEKKEHIRTLKCLVRLTVRLMPQD